MLKGHISALITILIWGTTFISTKILLNDFQPIEILLIRFVIGTIALFLIDPHPLKINNKKQEIIFMFAGLFGVCLYYLLENIALTYTLASNVGVIISIAPFFTGILDHFFDKNEEKLSLRFLLGFMMAMIGISIISFHGKTLKLNPLGDVFAIFAALVWAIYSILSKKISTYGYHTIQTTRRIFLYGLLFMIPSLFIFDFHIQISLLFKPIDLFHMLFLGLGASALCFVTWNEAVKILGAMKTSIYIYLVPIITLITSMIVFNEKVTFMTFIGILFTITGLLLSENKRKEDVL